jgi:hypothetical protein
MRFFMLHRPWLGRIALSLGLALVAGALAYLVARAITGAVLLYQQQQFLGEVASAFSGGIENLPGGDLRAARKLVQQLDAQNDLLSLLIGFAVAATAAVAGYLWLERRAAEMIEDS